MGEGAVCGQGMHRGEAARGPHHTRVGLAVAAHSFVSPPSPLSPGPYFAGVADKTVTVLLKLAERQENRVALVEAGVPAGVEAFLAAHGAAAGPGSLPVGVIQKAKDVLVELLEPLDAGTA